MATQVNWVSVTFIVKNLTSPCYNQNLFFVFFYRSIYGFNFKYFGSKSLNSCEGVEKHILPNVTRLSFVVQIYLDHHLRPPRPSGSQRCL